MTTTTLKLLVYSPVGHGKTSLLGTAHGDARLTPALILDFEGGLDSIASKVTPLEKLDQKVEPGKIYFWRVKAWDDFDTVHQSLSRQNPFKLVAIDSLTEANYLLNQTILSRAVGLNPRHDPDVLEQMDYQRSAVWARRLVRVYRDLECHVVMTALAQDIQDPISRQIEVRPNLTGKLSVEIPAMFSIVGYLGLVGESSERHLFTQPAGRFLAKDRSEGGKLGGDLPNPTLPKILDLLTK
jgi:hypothetical protein